MLISIVLVGHLYKFHAMQLCFVKMIYLGQTVIFLGQTVIIMYNFNNFNSSTTNVAGILKTTIMCTNKKLYNLSYLTKF